uniref:Kelch repeat protein n=1 Tax=Rhabditophanes sp. KR3021 TaxID=114890 RepID=A0AC35UES7_9BILA
MEIDQLRTDFATTNLNNKIWMIGGLANNKISNIVQSFDSEKMQWFDEQSLPITMCGHSAVSIPSENSIYVTPGCFNADNMRRYDPRVKGWQTLAEIPMKRQGAGVCLLDKNIVYCGGTKKEDSNWTYRNNCHIYDVSANKWIETITMPIGMCNFKAINLAKEILIFGGLTDGKFMKDIYSFDKNYNIWTKCDLELVFPNSSFSLSAY